MSAENLTLEARARYERAERECLRGNPEKRIYEAGADIGQSLGRLPGVGLGVPVVSFAKDTDNA